MATLGEPAGHDCRLVPVAALEELCRRVEAAELIAKRGELRPPRPSSASDGARPPSRSSSVTRPKRKDSRNDLYSGFTQTTTLVETSATVRRNSTGGRAQGAAARPKQTRRVGSEIRATSVPGNLGPSSPSSNAELPELPTVESRPRCVDVGTQVRPGGPYVDVVCRCDQPDEDPEMADVACQTEVITEANAPTWQGLKAEPAWRAVAELIQSPVPAVLPVIRPASPRREVPSSPTGFRIPLREKYVPEVDADVWGFGVKQHAEVESAVQRLGASIEAERSAIQQVRHRAQIAMRSRA